MVSPLFKVLMLMSRALAHRRVVVCQLQDVGKSYSRFSIELQEAS